MPANMENSSLDTGMEKVSFHSILKERQCQRMFKLMHSCTHLTLLQSNAKILQVRFQQYVNQELPDIQAGYRKGRGSRDHIVNICWTIPKAIEFQKTSTFTSLTTQKPLTVWITTNWKFFQEMGLPDHLTCLLRNLYAGQEAIIRPGQGTMFKIGKEVHQGFIVTLLI